MAWVFTRMGFSGAVCGAVLAVCAAGEARADSIDGNWCAPDGRQMTINGPEIVTPSGARTSGNYGRHDFSYTPPGGRDVVSMRLMNETTIQLRPSQTCERTEVWQRCQRPTS
jgi:hypothetical protein